MYKINYVKSFKKDLKKLPIDVRRRIVIKIKTLANNPRPVGSQKLRSQDNLYRIRAGTYRIIYKIEDSELVVIVMATGHRKEIYEKIR